MARTTAEIKTAMTEVFCKNATISELYGLDPDKTFDEQFSKASLESILFYIVAFAIYTFEKILDLHKQEVTTIINELKPHTLRWYVNKTKEFRKGQPLIDDTDQYSDENLTPEDIAKLQIVTYASAEERSGTLLIKVAKGSDNIEPLSKTDPSEFDALQEYLAEVKDAGVRIVLRSAEPDILLLNLTIHYNPMILQIDGKSLNGGEPVLNAINNYIKNLPFNGEYRNADLIDILQRVEGVVIATLNSASSSFDNDSFNDIDILERPLSGYYTFDLSRSSIEYIAYENVLY
jgi:hypothetical protein